MKIRNKNGDLSHNLFEKFKTGGVRDIVTKFTKAEQTDIFIQERDIRDEVKQGFTLIHKKLVSS